jgi:circadian clock protein KaiC
MQNPDPRISTGTEGLDLVLKRGLTPGRTYLLEGAPGSGKTTLGLQYLRDGVAIDSLDARRPWDAEDVL